jgi:PAS domain S-box-containing protein
MTRRLDTSGLLVCVAVLFPLTTLVGWALDSPFLEATGISAGPRMNPFSALSLLCLAATWFSLFRLGHPRLAHLIALVPLSIGVFRLLEYGTGTNSRFDLLLFHKRILNQAHPNQIAPNSAFMIAGLAMAMMLSGRKRWRDEMSAWLAICTGTVPFFAILGYASQLGSLYGIALPTPMALNTAVAGLLLTVAILANLRETNPVRPFSSPTSGGLMARRLFPVALGIPTVASLMLSTAVNRALLDRATASAVFSIAVVILVAVVIHRTASRLDEFDTTRTRQSETIQEQNRQLTGLVHQLQSRSDELAVAHSSLNAVLDAATQVGIVGLDTSGTIRFFNAGAEAILGFRSADVVGAITLAAFCETPTALDSLVSKAGKGAINESDVTMIRRDGTGFTANVSVTLQHDERRAPRGYLAVIRDITEARRHEALLREAKQLAESAARSKSDFLATMSHEIRTPMNGVIGMTGLLLDTALSDEQREYAATIRNSGESLLGILNDILDFSKIEAGKLELEDIDFDLYTTIEECAEIVASGAHRKGLELILPARIAEWDLVSGDQGRLRQILLNLVSNAVKFTAAGEVAIEVSIAPEAHAGEGSNRGLVRIEVRDTGIGIPAAVKSQLFTAFTQADASTTRRFGGTGLGLAISKRLAELMGGEIGAISEEGRGSTFWFTVRLGLTKAGPALPRQVSGKALLVVDDNETNRRVLQLQAEHLGYNVRLAESAGQALELLGSGKGRFDGILSDLRMPLMDGFDLVAAIRGNPATADLPIVLLTSHEDRERAKAAGVNDVLLKPVRESQLARSLDRVFADRAESPAETGKPAAAPDPAGLRPGRVLVAEDNPVNQKVIAMMLKKLGYTADVVANGREVLSALPGGAYDVVLMDCQMPEMDGFEATHAIRTGEFAEGVPIIALTANALAGEKDRCVAAGMDDYLAKPIKQEALGRKLEEWIRRHPHNAHA